MDIRTLIEDLHEIATGRYVARADADDEPLEAGERANELRVLISEELDEMSVADLSRDDDTKLCNFLPGKGDIQTCSDCGHSYLEPRDAVPKQRVCGGE